MPKQSVTGVVVGTRPPRRRDVVAPERDVRTGRVGGDRSAKDGRSNVDVTRRLAPSGGKPRWLMPAVVAIVATTIAAVAAVAVSGGDEQDRGDVATATSTTLSVSSTAGAPIAPATATIAPPTSASSPPITTTAAPAIVERVFVSYEGGSVADYDGFTNPPNGTPRAVIQCQRDACVFQPPISSGGTQQLVPLTGGRWTHSETVDMGPVCIAGSTGVARGRELIIYSWDLAPEGTMSRRGIDVPQIIRGTYRVDNSLPEGCGRSSFVVYDVSATPTD